MGPGGPVMASCMLERLRAGLGSFLRLGSWMLQQSWCSAEGLEDDQGCSGLQSRLKGEASEGC